MACKPLQEEAEEKEKESVIEAMIEDVKTNDKTEGEGWNIIKGKTTSSMKRKMIEEIERKGGGRKESKKEQLRKLNKLEGSLSGKLKTTKSFGSHFLCQTIKRKHKTYDFCGQINRPQAL